MASNARVLHLDVLRAVAILLVLGVHTPERSPAGAWGHAFLDTWQRCGWAGVDVFFALSGYLIVGLLLDERHRTGTIDAKAFAWRRVFKIYPPYLLFLVAAIAWYVHAGTLPGCSAVLAAFWPTAVHLQNYIPVRVTPHIWSLAMEEHCYTLLLALVFFAGRRRDPLQSRTIPFVLLAAFAVSWLGRWAYVLWGYSGTGPIGFAYTHNRLDAVVAGSLAAWLVRRARAGTAQPVWTRWRGVVLGVSAICFIPTLLIDIYAHRTWTFLGILPVQALGFGLLLLGLSERPANVGVASTKARPAWLLRAVAFIGISSYSTYLWHWPFAEVLLRDVPLGDANGHPAGSLVRVAAYVAIAVGMGIVSFVLVERPALAWRRRWLAERRSVEGRAHLHPSGTA